MVFDTPCWIFLRMASVGLQGITHWYLILNLKNEYGKKYIQSAVLRERQQGEKRLTGLWRSSAISRVSRKRFGTWKGTGRKARVRKYVISTLPLTTSRLKSSSTTCVYSTVKRSWRLKWWAMLIRVSAVSMRHCSKRPDVRTKYSRSVSEKTG